MTAHDQIRAAILYLAGRCDGAARKDGHGFNGRDAGFGRSLADQIAAGRPMSPRQWEAALKVLRTYEHSQLAPAGLLLPTDLPTQPVAPVAPAGVAPTRQSITLTATVNRILVAKESTGWCLLLVRPADGATLPAGSTRFGEARVKGVLPGIQQGREVEFTGRWVEGRDGGMEFDATNVKAAVPRTREGVERYLQTLPGIGPALARKAFAHLASPNPAQGQVPLTAEQVYARLAADPGLLAAVPGVKSKGAKAIDQAKSEQEQAAVLTQLLGWGLTPRQAQKAIEVYGLDKVAGVVAMNPYRLAEDVGGIGFKRADEIARSIGVPHDSPHRAQAGLLHVLESATDEGHCYLERSQPGYKRDTGWLSLAVDLLQVEPVLVEQARDSLVADKRAVAEGGALYHRRLWVAETEVAQSLRARAALPKRTPLAEVGVTRWQALHKMTLAPAQVDAVRMIVESPVCVLTGGPGTGKTSVIRCAVDLLEARGVHVALAAPTGKAARRMAQATGRDASTIHRLIGLRNEDGQTETLLASVGALVLDESSMMDIALTRAVCRALPLTAQLILVGDVDQLPSVGPGQVLRDVILSDAVPTVRLTQIFRQAQGSAVIDGAHAINHGDMPRMTCWQGRPVPGALALDEVQDRGLVALRTFEAVQALLAEGYRLDEVMVLSPQRGSGEEGDAGVNGLNVLMQARLNPTGEPIRKGAWIRVGDRVLQTKNDYELDVRNGDVGTVAGIQADKKVVVLFDDGRRVAYPPDGDGIRNLTLGYALTVHKSQGSEARAVVMVVTQTHRFMLRRRLLYTGVTRGKQTVVLVGEPQAIAQAVRNDREDKRNTRLMDRLMHSGEAG